MEVLGIDVGGSAVKGAPVDIKTGEVLAPRLRIATPEPPKPEDMAQIVAEIARHFSWNGPIGCGFPAALPQGIVLTAANIHKNWIGVDVASLFAEATGCPTKVINDADAAGIAEMWYGAGKGHDGVVMVITLGTGIGTALFTNGHLLPNTELGHLELNGRDAEQWASAAARKRDKLSWKRWAKRLNAYLNRLEEHFYPDLIIVGGGVSKRSEKFFPYLNLRAELVPAQFRNLAGIIGAAAIFRPHIGN